MTSLEELVQQIERVEGQAGARRTEVGNEVKVSSGSVRTGVPPQELGPETYHLAERGSCETGSLLGFIGAAICLVVLPMIVSSMLASRTKLDGIAWTIFFGGLVTVCLLGVGFGQRSRIYEVRIPPLGPISFLSIDREKKVLPADIVDLVRYEHYRTGALDHFDLVCRTGFGGRDTIGISGPAPEVLFTRLRSACPQASVQAEKYDPDPD